jgi:hypothetical protein
MAEFSQLMAQMISEARPKRTGGQQLPHMIGGGGGGATFGKQKESSISAKVDIDPWMRLFGYRSDAEMKKLYEGLYEQKAMNPDSWATVKDSPPLQKSMKALYRRGHPVKVNKDGTFDLPEVSQEERITKFKPTKEQVSTGAFGETARRQAIDAEKEVTPPSAVEIMSGERGTPGAREKLIEGEKEVRAPHPSEIELNQAKIDVEKTNQQLKQKELELLPDEFKMKQVEHQTRLTVLQKEMKGIDAQIAHYDLQNQMLKEGKSKEEMTNIRSINNSYDSFLQSWMTKHTLTPDDEKNNYLKIAELGAATQSHIAGIKTFSEEPKATEKSVRYMFSQIDREMDRPTLQPKSFPIIGSGAGQTAIAEQAARRRYYVKSATGLLQQSGSNSVDLYGSLYGWAAKAGYNDKDLLKLMQSFGFNEKQITAIINNAALRFK